MEGRPTQTTQQTRGRTRAASAAPERLVFEPREGAPGRERAPVRIFVGSEPAQERAERVFVWSVLRARDPARRYEIHLMRDLAGFARRGWTTGFTNYRFAVPHFAGGCGRAIYNDVDQIYRSDPARLFDTPLRERGFLAVAPDDSSVMLLDCARMASVWTLELARRERKSRLLERTLETPDLYGALDPRWNVRDDESAPEAAFLIHYTTLHTQPWRPFPERYAYQPSEVGEVWHALEREADAAGFRVFTRARPSARYAAWCAGLALPAPRDGEFRPPRPGAPRPAPRPALRAGRWLAGAPREDLPWLLDELCAAAREELVLELPGTPTRRERMRWEERLSSAARAHPALAWRIEAASGVRVGGAWRSAAAPRVWVLRDDRPGNATQSLGLADALGWPYEVKTLRCRAAAGLHNRWLGATRLGVDPEASSPLEAPWPDLVIAAGRRCAPVAQWIRERAGGSTRLVMLGRKAGDDAELFDRVVTPGYTRLFPHPRRIPTSAPLHRVTGESLRKAAEEWADRLADAPAPRIAVLVGGSSGQYALDADVAARLGRDCAELARRCGGSLFATTSRRLGRAASDAFCAALGPVHFLHRFAPDDPRNPYLALLAHADAFVITGDSESMLAEACSLGRPVAIYPLPLRRSFRALSALREWVWRRATAKPLGPRGTPRPQRGLERLCGRSIERGFVRPSRDLERLHAALVARGVAQRFDGALRFTRSGPLPDERAAVAGALRELLGVR